MELMVELMAGGAETAGAEEVLLLGTGMGAALLTIALELGAGGGTTTVLELEAGGTTTALELRAGGGTTTALELEAGGGTTTALELGAGGGTTTALELGMGAAEEVTMGMVTGAEEVKMGMVTGTEEDVGSTGQTVVPMVIVSVVTVVE